MNKPQVPFEHRKTEVLEGDPRQALVLPKIADILRQHKGQLKLLIEGHHGPDEPEGTDVERSLDVYQWLVAVAGCPPGLLRIAGRGTGMGMGKVAVPVPIQELLAAKGPLPADLEMMTVKPGLYFGDRSAELSKESKEIAARMAALIVEDEHKVRVEGHVHRDEPEGLAMDRARAVLDALVGLGVARDQATAVTCKSLHPLSRLHGAPNRRAEVHIE